MSSLFENNYHNKILPYIESHSIGNPLVKTPLIGTGFELKELARSMRADEDILFLTRCKINKGKGILVCVTNLRLYLVDKGLFLDKTLVAIDLSKVNNVSRGRQLFFGSVRVTTVSEYGDFLLTDFWGRDTEEFQTILQDAVTDFGMGNQFRSQKFNGGNQGFNQNQNGFSSQVSSDSTVGVSSQNASAWASLVEAPTGMSAQEHANNGVSPDIMMKKSALDEAFRVGAIDVTTYKQKMQELGLF